MYETPSDSCYPPQEVPTWTQTVGTTWYPNYEYLPVGEKLYRFNKATGQTWYESYGDWILVREPKENE